MRAARPAPSRRLLEGRLPDAPPEASSVDLERLRCDFFANPTAYLLRERLGVRLAEAARRPSTTASPSCWTGSAAYVVRDELLAPAGPTRDRATILLRGVRARRPPAASGGWATSSSRGSAPWSRISPSASHA